MRCRILALVVFLACKDEKPPPPPPPQPPHDGLTLIQPGTPPYQALRYHLTKGTRSASEVVCDTDVKDNGQSGPMPTLVIGLETAVEDVLADGTAKLRVTIVRTSVRDRPGSPVTSDLVRDEATAMQGVVITETLAPDGSLTDSRVEIAAALSDKARAQLDNLTRILEQVAMRIPSEPVGVGATWRERRTLPDGGIKAVSETTYTLTSITGSTVAYTSAGLSSGVPHNLEQDGMKVEVTNTRGHAEAKGSVDLSRYAVELTSTSEFATAMNVVAPAGTPGGGPSTVEITMAIQVRPADVASADSGPPPAPSGTAPPAPSGTAPPAPSGTAPSTGTDSLEAGSAHGAHKAP